MTPRIQGCVARRQAFTLTELLVVIAIMGILASLVAAFVFGTSNRRRAGNTELAIQTVNKIFQHHWSQVIADAKAEDISDPTVFANLQILSGKTSGLDPSGERAKVIWVKLRVMEAFPQSYAEVTNPANAVYKTLNTYIPDPSTNKNLRKSWRKHRTTYQKYLGGKTIAIDPNTESAACLLMALSAVTRAGSNLSPDSLGYAIADTDQDGIKELVDAWMQPSANPPDPNEPAHKNPGNAVPLRFYRFAWNSDPTWTHNIQQRMPNLGTSASAASAGILTPDPVDTKGLLLNPLWYNQKVGGLGQLGVAYCRAIECAIGTIPATAQAPPNYIVPVIVSAGPDNWFGLNQVLPTTSPIVARYGELGPINTAGNADAVLRGVADDNIYSYEMRNQ